MSTEAQDWTDKVVLLYVKESGPATQAGIAMQNPHVVTLLGERFLVGEVPPFGSSRPPIRQVGVRLSRIVHFLVFASLSEYQKRVREAPQIYEAAQDAETAGPPS